MLHGTRFPVMRRFLSKSSTSKLWQSGAKVITALSGLLSFLRVKKTPFSPACKPCILSRMSMTEILDELPRLAPGERQAIFRRLMEIDPALEAEETPEMLEAIDAGVRSLETGGGVGIGEARQRVAQWISK